LSEPELADFLFQQAQLWRAVRLWSRAPELLSSLSKLEVLLGLASNCQPHTLRELDTALGRAGLSFSIFKPELCFFSFTHGFAKPNPHVFRTLSARLRKLRISPAETLMVGDRLDNDIDAARAQGFCAWQLTRSPTNEGTQSGDWSQLAAYLNVSILKSAQR
jgi:FMN phosphatase YigB (HAD superfamily)